MYGMIEGNKSSIRVSLPDELIEKYNNFILPFSSNTLYDSKNQVISFNYSGTPERYKLILIGFFTNKSFEVLSLCALLKVYIVEGEKIRLKVGSFHRLQIPNNDSNKGFSNRIYRIESNE